MAAPLLLSIRELRRGGKFRHDRSYCFLQTALRATLMIGFCGGFTTFSSFTLETLALAQTGAWARAALYVAMSTVICLAATAAGFAIGKPLNP